jgi:sulfur carrier protein
VIIERSTKMQITINGEPEQFDEESLSVARLLEAKNVESPEMVSVQVNGEFVDKTNYQDTVLSDNDTVEFLYFMGGGATS